MRAVRVQRLLLWGEMEVTTVSGGRSGQAGCQRDSGGGPGGGGTGQTGEDGGVYGLDGREGHINFVGV